MHWRSGRSAWAKQEGKNRKRVAVAVAELRCTYSAGPSASGSGIEDRSAAARALPRRDRHDLPASGSSAERAPRLNITFLSVD